MGHNRAMRAIRSAAVAVLLALAMLAGAPAARAEVDIWSWPVIRWFTGFGSYGSERASLQKALTCARTAEERLPSGVLRFTCLNGERNRIQVFLESTALKPDEVQRVVFRWRTAANAKVGIAAPPSAADKALAVDTLRRLADLFVPGKTDELVALLGEPGTGRLVSRGRVAIYLLFADPEGDQYIVEFQDASAARQRERERSQEEAGLKRCRALIHAIPRFKDMELASRQRQRDDGDHVSYLVVGSGATFVCEFYPNGYYRIMGATKDSEEYGIVAHGIN